MLRIYGNGQSYFDDLTYFDFHLCIFDDRNDLFGRS